MFPQDTRLKYFTIDTNLLVENSLIEVTCEQEYIIG